MQDLENASATIPPEPPRMVWVTGAGGLIGSHLVRSAPRWARAIRVRGLGRSDLDLADFRAVERRFREERPDAVIHCAAISSNPACDRDPKQARRINVEATQYLAELAQAGRLVFFSTDLVFDGRRGWYTETDPVAPAGVYAETKVLAEAAVLQFPGHLVVRTSLNGGRSPTGDRGFNERLRQAWRAGRVLDLFTDEFRCPLPAEVTARAVWELVLQGAAGLFHLAGSERLSRYAIGRLVAERCPELHPQLRPASIRDYTGGPPRVPDASLNCAKLQARLPFPLPGLTAWMRDHADAWM